MPSDGEPTRTSDAREPLPEHADAVVVGAGILGLATARELLRRRPGWSVLVLEKEAAPGLHQSGRNSCVLHAGVYYAPNSLKARLCRDGRRLMLDFCGEHDVPVDLTGKLIVATHARELGRLEELERRARANGLEGVRVLTGSEIADVEPHVRGRLALHVPESGIVDFRRVVDALVSDVVARGGRVATSTAVRRLAEGSGGVIASTVRGEVRARVAVACAGVHSDRLAQASGASGDVEILPFRGSYFALAPDAAAWCRGLIYPVPDPLLPFLGVHVNRRPDGAVWVGPNAVLAFDREGYRRRRVRLQDVRDIVFSAPFWRMARRHWRAAAIELTRDTVPHLVARSVARFLPEVEREHLRPAVAGIRAQALLPDGSLADDFLFAESARVLHVQNAPSPAATSSLAIAEVLAAKTIEKTDS